MPGRFWLSGRADRLFLSAEIAATDREIDGLVCALDGLTEDKIAIVEWARKVSVPPNEVNEP